MYVPRESILLRSKRQEGGLANIENCDKEYEKEQARIAAKAAKQASMQARLVGAYYARPDEKRQAWEEAQAEAQRLSHAKAEAQQRQHQREVEWLSQPQHVFVDSQRPYTASCSTYYMPVEMEVEARRRAQREADIVNRHMQAQRVLAEQQRHSAEQQAIKSTMQAEDAWFNRGAASERWVPPEHRVHKRSEIPPHLALAPPPYFCDDDDAQTEASCSTSASQPRVQPSSAGMVQPQRPASTSAVSAARLREGAGARAALSHDIAFASEASAHVRQQQSRSSKQAMQHPWSWAT